MIVVIVILCLGALIVEARTKIVRRALDDLIYDNRNHYLPCEKLSAETEVRKIVQEHQDVVNLPEDVTEEKRKYGYTRNQDAQQGNLLFRCERFAANGEDDILNDNAAPRVQGRRIG